MRNNQTRLIDWVQEMTGTFHVHRERPLVNPQRFKRHYGYRFRRC